MNDMPTDIFDSLVRAIDERSAIYERYSRILEAQRIAVRSNDISKTAKLANAVDRILEELQANWPRLQPAEDFLQDSRSNGARVQTIRDRLTIVAAKAALAQVGVRDLTSELTGQRHELRAEMVAEFGALPGELPKIRHDPSPFQPNSLIDATG